MVLESQLTDLMTDKGGSSHLYKQILAATTSCLLCMCGGFTYGYSAVLVPLVKRDDNFPYDDYYDSWIAASAPLAMAFGCIFSGVLMDKFGRKYVQILLMWPFLVGYLVLAFAKTVTYLLIGRILTGMCTGVFRSLGVVYLVEISDPANRPILLFTLSTSANLGIMISHAIGVLPIKTSCLIFTTPILVAFICLLFLKESPLWLISKGKIEEGIDSFQWFRCKDEASCKELVDVIEKQNKKESNKNITEHLNLIFSKKFFKAYITAFLLFVSIQFCGVNNLIFYAQDLLQPTFDGKINSYLMMITVDSLRILGSGMLLPFSKHCSRRKSFFVICSIIILMLIGIIIYLIVSPSKLTWLLCSCLVIFITIGSLMVSLTWTFIAEIFPNEIRGVGSGMSSASSFLLLFVSVKITPGIMVNFGIIAMYSTFAIVTLIAFLILLFILPETDGKTLHEIENNSKK